MSILLNTSVFAIDWYEEYNTKWKNGINPSSTLPWSETYILRSYISMYRASKARGEPEAEQQKWLDRLIEHCDYVLNSSDMEAEGKSNFVYAGHGFTPLARFVKMIFKDENLYSQYKEKANSYLYYLESRIVPYWRNQPEDSQWWFTPFNWYLSYGSLLMNLCQVSRLKYYKLPYYSSPDASLSNYYYNTVFVMVNNHFQDFRYWDYTHTNWQWDNTCFPKLGLCHCPLPLDAYIWRYYDYSDYPAISGSNQLVEARKSVNSNEWYHIVLMHQNDSLSIQWYDSTGIDLIYSKTVPWIFIPTNSDLYIGRRLDAPSSAYLEGTLDELKFLKGDSIVAYWSFDGNADDVSGKGHDGVIHGTPEWVDGKVGKAIKFNHDYIIVPYQSDLDDFSQIEFWIKFSESSPKYYNYILGKGFGFPDTTGFHIYTYCYKRPEDVGHANLDIEFIVKAVQDYSFSMAYSIEDMERLCNTFTKIIHSNSDSVHPEFRSHLHPDSSYGDLNSSTHTFRWLWLYKFEPVIGELISNWYEDHPDDRLNEAIANLACWQAGLNEDEYDYEPTPVIEYKTDDISLSVIPNPSFDNITIRFNFASSSFAEFVIFDELGNVVLKRRKEPVSCGLNEKRLSLENINSGMYYCRINIGGLTIIRPLSIIK